MEKNMLLLLETLYENYGYDFRQYSKAHVRRRINHFLSVSKFKSIEEIHAAILTDPRTTALLLQDLSVTVTEMFRDTEFFSALRKEVIPILKTYPFIKIWHAGCSTGQEAYSMAILLSEEGLYDRTTLYATDFNDQALQTARDGIYPVEDLVDYEENYMQSDGKYSFSRYYNSNYGHGIMNSELKKNIVWANHNLVTDSVFAEAHLILCRNVMIYFDRELQNRVHGLFYNSLIRGGVLCLGSKENIRFTSVADKYKPINERLRIYKKKFILNDNADLNE